MTHMITAIVRPRGRHRRPTAADVIMLNLWIGSAALWAALFMVIGYLAAGAR